jgi:hypothetical protein
MYAGQNISMFVSTFKTVLFLLILIIIIIYSLVEKSSYYSINIFFVFLASFMTSISMYNLVVFDKYNLEIAFILISTILIFMSYFLHYRFNSQNYEYLIKWLFYTGLIVVVFGFFEHFFISDSLIEASRYFYWLSLAKGQNLFNSYVVHGTPDNLFTMNIEYQQRRMISFIGDPLYLGYYLSALSILSYIRFYFLKSLSSFVYFILFCLALILTYSRLSLLAMLIGVIFFHILKIKNKKYLTIVLLVSPVFILSLSSIYLINKIDSDVSSMGHIQSFLAGMTHIGTMGLIFPSFNTNLNNFIAIKYNMDTGVESALLILISNIGILSLFAILLISFSMIKMLNNSRSILLESHKNIRSFTFIYKISFPFILLGYLSTIVFSPQLMTYQTSLFVSGLVILYNNLRKGEIKR